MKTALILLGVYLIVFPLLVRLFAALHRKLQVKWALKKTGAKNIAALKDLPRPLWATWKERLGFTFKDTRQLSLPAKGEAEPKTLGVDRRSVFFALYALGALLFVLPAWIGGYKLAIAGFVVFLLSVFFGIFSPRKVLEIRHRKINRMFEVAQLKLGIKDADATKAVRVEKWDDLIEPRLVRFEIPMSFSSENEEGFLRHFNQFFGTEVAWVADVDDHKGWDYAEGELWLRTVPPLPTMAPWDEHYFTSEHVAWSFFPLGLGIRNGVSLPNPNKDGQIENVIGFDVFGEQKDLASKHSIVLGHELMSPAPMSLFAGGTGSGKAIAGDAPVLVRVAKHEQA